MGNKAASINEQTMADIHDLVKVSMQSDPSTVSASSRYSSTRSSTGPQLQDGTVSAPHSKHQISPSFAGRIQKALRLNEKQTNEQISSRMLAQQMQQARSLQLVLMGDASSGKNAIFQQMRRVVHCNLDVAEREYALSRIRSRILRDFVRLCEHNNSLNVSAEVYKLPNSELQAICDGLASAASAFSSVSQELAVDIYAVWSTQAMQRTFDDAKRLELVGEASGYFLDKVLEITSPDYIVTVDDLTMMQDERLQNSGLAQSQFVVESKFGKYMFNVSQIVGQKSESRRWTPWLDNVNAIVYVINLAVFDEIVPDGQERISCLQQAMRSFQALCGNHTFRRTNFIVFFNKIDAFHEKLQSVPFTGFGSGDDFDPFYANDADAVKMHVMAKLTKTFQRACSAGMKRGGLFFHEVNDDDTEQIAQILQKVQNDVVTSTMKRMGYVY